MAYTLLLFGLMLGIGSFLLLQSLAGWLYFIIAVAGGFWLRQLSKKTIKTMARGGLEPDYL